jgi:hypothetical protein
MMLVFTFLLVAVLESAAIHSDDKKEFDQAETVEEPDMCVGCDSKKEDKKKEEDTLQVEVVVDPETGKIRYVIKGLEIK